MSARGLRHPRWDQVVKDRGYRRDNVSAHRLSDLGRMVNLHVGGWPSLAKTRKAGLASFIVMPAKAKGRPALLLQLRVLRFCLLQYWDIGIGV